MSLNTGSAILIVGIGYLYFVYHLDLLISLAGIILGVTTWSYIAYSDQRKEIWKARARYWKAHADIEEKKNREIKNW